MKLPTCGDTKIMGRNDQNGAVSVLLVLLCQFGSIHQFCL